MTYSILKNAVKSSYSTILLSSLGRYPSMVEHYLSPHLLPLGDPFSGEPDVWFESIADQKPLYLWVEPPFGTTLPSHRRNLVLTSHLDLTWDPTTTRVVALRDYIPSFSGFLPDTVYNDLWIVPENQHPCPITPKEEVVDGITLDLRDIDDPHDAYLRIVTFCDVCKSTWNLCMSRNMRQRLARHFKRSHDAVTKHLPSLPHTSLSNTPFLCF